MNHDRSPHGHGTQTAEVPHAGEAVIDPVCGMTVDPHSVAGSVTRSWSHVSRIRVLTQSRRPAERRHQRGQM